MNGRWIKSGQAAKRRAFDELCWEAVGRGGRRLPALAGRRASGASPSRVAPLRLFATGGLACRRTWTDNGSSNRL